MHRRPRILSLFLCLCLILPSFAVFATEGSLPTLVFDSIEYAGETAELPYFYTVEDGAATLTDALSTLCGDAVLPQTLGGYPLRKIASGAFADSDGLTSVTVPQTVTEIESGAFAAGLLLCGVKGSTTEHFAQKAGFPFSIASVKGDLDRDGLANVNDLTTLARLLSGWDISYSPKGADLTGDREIGIADLTDCSRMLAGWTDPTLFLLGDETVNAQEASVSYFPAAGFGDALENAFSDCNVKNLAATGLSAKNALTSEQYLSLFNEVKTGDAVLLSFGIHDADSLASAFSPAEGDECTVGSFAYYLNEYYIKPLSARGARVILSTPVVERPLDGETFTDGCLRGDYPAAIRALAEKLDLDLLDVTALSRALYEDLGSQTNAYLNAWDTREAASLNRQNLSVFGAEQIGKLITDELSALDPEFFRTTPAEPMRFAAYLSTYAATSVPTVFTYSDGTTSTSDDTLITSDSYLVPESESLVSVEFGEGVLAIDDGAFALQYDLVTVTLPDTLERIGNRAFHSCNSLALSSLPASLTTIGQSAFYGCDSLTVTTLSEHVTEIGDYAFYGCNAIDSLTFDATAKEVPANAFRNCRSLASVSLHDYVERIGSRAFEGCCLIEEIDLPEELTSIGGRAFKGTSLTSLDLPETLLTLDAQALAGATVLSELYHPLLATEWLKVQKGADWYKDTSLSVITCADGDVTVEDVVLVDYHAYYSDPFIAFTDANSFVTTNADLTRFESADAKAAILLQDGVLTLKLLSDVVFTAKQPVTGTYTIDLKGHKINLAAAGVHFELAQDANLTIDDSVGGGKVYKYSSSSSAQYLYNMPSTGTSLTINGGVHTCENAGGTAIAVRGTGVKGSIFRMSNGTLSATTTSADGNAKAVQSPASVIITGGIFATKTQRGNSYTISGVGEYFCISGGTFDSYTHNGDSMPLYVGSGNTVKAYAEIYNGEFVAHATGKAGAHVAFCTAPGADAVVYNGSFTVDSRLTGDGGACGIATFGPNTTIYNAFAKGNNTGLQALGKNTTVYDGIFIGADHGGAYFSHANDIGTVCIFGGLFRYELPDWQASTSGTGSAYFNGGGNVYIDSATFEGRQISLSSDGGTTPATTIYVSRSEAPSWRVNGMHTVYFGKGMEGSITTEDGIVDFHTFSDTVFDENYVKGLDK